MLRYKEFYYYYLETIKISILISEKDSNARIRYCDEFRRPIIQRTYFLKNKQFLSLILSERVLEQFRKD
jgi:hypothetical protein